jgi:hypothetical protein
MSAQETSSTAALLLQGLDENHSAMKATKNLRERTDSMGVRKSLAGIIGVGAGGGNVAHLLTSADYFTAALNTAQADMKDINVNVKIAIENVNGSGKDRSFSAKEFKGFYPSFFNHDGIKKLLENDTIFIVGTGGGGTGTIISIMVAGFLKTEYPNKTIILVGLLGSTKEDLVSQYNMREFMSDLDTKAAECPYMLFDNNKVKNKVGDDVYDIVNQDAIAAIRVVAQEFFVENARSNIDGRDYARLTSFGGLLSVIIVDKLNISVTEESADLIPRLKSALASTTAIVTENPDAYGFFMNTQPDLYSKIDTTFDDIQSFIGKPTAGLVFRHLQNNTQVGPELAIIMTGMAAPIDRFKIIDRRIEEYETVTEKPKLPGVERHGTVNLASDAKRPGASGAGGNFLGDF